MTYYIGLELMGQGVKLLNVKKRGRKYSVEKSIAMDLRDEEVVSVAGERTKCFEVLKKQLEVVLNREKLKGYKLGILLPPGDVIRRTIKVPISIESEVDAYVQTNKMQLLPLPTDTFTVAFEVCSEQYDKQYRRYQIGGIDDTFLVPFTRWLAEQGLHTVAVMTIGDTLRWAIPSLEREGHYCVLLYTSDCCTILFYESKQCVYCHTIEFATQEEAQWVWEIFKVVRFTKPYEDNGEIECVLCVKSPDSPIDRMEEVSEWLGREIEYVPCSIPLDDAGLMGLVYQMSKGRRKSESCTRSV